MKRGACLAGDVCRLPGVDGEHDRVVLLLSDVTEGGAMVLVLHGRVATKEPGQTANLKGLVQLLLPL